ncbi:MAG: choice-of-anchor B family protein [Saprospiraceae bacterium]|nr:choice-of-anchor B family protein [Saprospiraceae bacterium]
MKRVIILIFFVQSWLQAQVYEFNTMQMAHWNEAGEDYSDIWGYAAAGREYAIIGSRTKIYFIDVTNPTAPVVIEAFGPFTSTSWREFKTYSHYAYAVTDGPDAGGLRIFDLQYLPDTVIQVRQTTAFFTKCHMPFIDEANARLYCAGTDTRNTGIIVLDLSTRPDSPSVLINQALPRGYVHDMFVKNNIVYASHGGNGLSQYDCTGATCTGELSHFQTGGYNHSSWMTADNNLMVNAIETPGHPLWLFKLTGGNISSENYKTFKSITLKEQYPNRPPEDTANIGHNPYIIGNRVYVSYYTDGVQIFDISDVNNIRRIAYFDTDRDHTSYFPVFRGCWGVYPFLPSGNILASDIQSGLWVFRVNEAALTLNFIQLKGRLIHINQIGLQLDFIAQAGTKSIWLEKSTDSITFNPFREIEGWKKLIKYHGSILDNEVSLNNYYRLRIINEDGSSTYSNVLNIKSTKSKIKIWPNPVEYRFNIVAVSDITKITLSDIQGRTLFKWINPPTSIDLPEMIGNGVYILEIQEGPVSNFSKLIVQR